MLAGVKCSPQGGAAAAPPLDLSSWCDLRWPWYVGADTSAAAPGGADRTWPPPHAQASRPSALAATAAAQPPLLTTDRLPPPPPPPATHPSAVRGGRHSSQPPFVPRGAARFAPRPSGPRPPPSSPPRPTLAALIVLQLRRSPQRSPGRRAGPLEPVGQQLARRALALAMDDKGTLTPSSARTGYRASAARCKLRPALFELLVRLVLRQRQAGRGTTVS